jgi:hypothetical protein
MTPQKPSCESQDDCGNSAAVSAPLSVCGSPCLILLVPYRLYCYLLIFLWCCSGAWQCSQGLTCAAYSLWVSLFILWVILWSCHYLLILDTCGQQDDSRSRWPHDQRHEVSGPAWTLGSWVRIPLDTWMSVCVYSVCVVLCVGSGRVTSWSSVHGVLPTVYRITKLKQRPGPNKGL